MPNETDWTPIRKPTPWPNTKPVVDGVTPVSAVSQDPYLVVDTEDELQKVMGV